MWDGATEVPDKRAEQDKLSVELWTMLTRYARWCDADLLPGELSLRRTWRALSASPAKAFNTRARLSAKQSLAASEAPGATKGVGGMDLWYGMRALFRIGEKRGGKGRVSNPENDKLLSLPRGSALDGALRDEIDPERSADAVMACFFGGIDGVNRVAASERIVSAPAEAGDGAPATLLLRFERFREFILHGPELTFLSAAPPALPEQLSALAPAPPSAALALAAATAGARGRGEEAAAVTPEAPDVPNVMLHVVTRHGVIDLSVGTRTTFLQLQHLVRRKLFWQEHDITGSKLARHGGQLVLPRLCAHFGTIPVEAHPGTPIAKLFRDHETLFIGMVEEEGRSAGGSGAAGRGVPDPRQRRAKVRG